MDDPLLAMLQRLSVALLVGLLIGLDRERAEARKGRALFAGVRTFPLIALAGAMPMLLHERIGPSLLIASFVAVAGIALVSYIRTAAEGRGATTEVAAIAAFLLGALAGAGELVVAGATGVAVAVLLVAKLPLETFSRAVSNEELTAVLELAVISVIVLPLLPDRGYGPWEALNPREIWLVVVLVSGLSFLGFIAIRLLGERRGLIAAGALGGLVSSTAVTFAMAERSLAGATRAAASGATLASVIMALRILVLAGLVDTRILPMLAFPMLAMAIPGALVAWLLARGQQRKQPGSTSAVTNPFSLRAALAFGALYAAVVLGVRAAQEFLGEGGVYVAAALSGVADVDALTVALTRLGRRTSEWRVPVFAITTAAVSNNVFKLVVGVARGAGSFRLLLALALGGMSVTGLLAGIAVAHWR